MIHGTASFAARITDDDGIEIVIGGPVVNPHDKQRRGAGVYCVVPSGEDDAATREACLAGRGGRGVLQAVPEGDPRRRLTEIALAVRTSTAGERAVWPIEFPGGLCEPGRWEWTTPPHGQG